MPPPEPLMRAAQTQLLLRSIEHLPAADRDAVLALIAPADREAVDAALPVAWHSMDLHMRVADALRDVVGPERNVRVWSETMAACFERPLLRGFVEMSTSLFGITPLSMLRRSGAIYLHIARDLGTLAFEAPPEPGVGDVTLRGFPADRYRFACYVEGLHGCLDAVLPVAGARGEVKVVDVVPARGEVRYRLSWEPGVRGGAS